MDARNEHGKIRFVYYKVHGYDSTWRADQLSRLFVGNRMIPVHLAAHDPIGVRFNFNADNDRWKWNDETFTSQAVTLL